MVVTGQRSAISQSLTTQGKGIHAQALGMMVIPMLASATLVNSALCAPPYQYGWWDKGPHGEPQWRGSWGRGGHWVRHGPRWVYRSPPHPSDRR